MSLSRSYPGIPIPVGPPIPKAMNRLMCCGFEVYGELTEAV